MLKLAPLALYVAAAGCVALPAGQARPTTYDDLRREDGWLLLDSVPHVAQSSRSDCGAASLAMVLALWGVDASVESLGIECAAPGDEGLRASALRDAARRRGLAAFVFAGRMEDLEHELRRGRPVVVGLMKSAGPATASHYEVVVGLHPATQRVATLDPASGLVLNELSEFAREWEAARGVTLVVFRPAAPAASPTAGGP